ncbi:MAG TPA: glycosyltransferase [Bacteroidales bacterium]|nr:glycosyltransferase [Bacteroidales bacterium]HSA43412.1 glycosyltransferase [Bacteroidales bacterium]
MNSVKVYGLGWHEKFSSSVMDFLIEPLRGKLKMAFITWDGTTDFSLSDHSPVVFCQFLPPASVLAEPELNITWIPMWDNVALYPPDWWFRIPSHLKIVSFSARIDALAAKSGHRNISLRFYKNPDHFTTSDWSKHLHLFYWNRIDMISPGYLFRFCNKLKIREITLINRPDPGCRPFSTEDVAFLRRRFKVNVITHFLDHSEYFRLLSLANLFLAPRWNEGIGMSFIEAMCAGQCVFAVDNPTMNEYITHKSNGVLLENKLFSPSLKLRVVNKVRRLAGWYIPDYSENWPSLSGDQDLAGLKRPELESMALSARETMQTGFQRWSASLDQFASFIETR